MGLDSNYNIQPNPFLNGQYQFGIGGNNPNGTGAIATGTSVFTKYNESKSVPAQPTTNNANPIALLAKFALNKMTSFMGQSITPPPEETPPSSPAQDPAPPTDETADAGEIPNPDEMPEKDQEKTA